MVIRNLTILFITALELSSCQDDTDFATDCSDLGSVVITSGDKTVTLGRDTAWYVADSEGRRMYSCDEYKMSAFFNVMRDIQVMGLSSHTQDGGFDAEVTLKKPSGSTVKQLRLKAVTGSPQMIGSINGGKCYVIGVPGLNVNPISNFNATADYWKDLALLELSPYNISKISVENYIEPSQSFSINTSGDGFEAVAGNGTPLSGVTEQSVRRWLGSIGGRYRASEYVDDERFTPGDTIYRLTVRSKIGIEEPIVFFKKFNGTKPDFNLMFFSKNGEHGTAKYYDFDKVLIDAEKLKIDK